MCLFVNDGLVAALSLKGRDFISMTDFGKDDLLSVLTLARELKLEVREKRALTSLSGRVIGLLFEKPSTRTRAGFETAVAQLGGSAVYMRADELQLKRGEPIKDTARILGGYLDGVIVRTYDQQMLNEFAEYSPTPVINALTDLEHPTQIVCDLMTIMEVRGGLAGLTLAWIGDGNNVCNSLMLGCGIVGLNLNVATPAKYKPDTSIVMKAEALAEKSGSAIRLYTDPKEAVKNADILYTDVWVSMGQEKQQAKKFAAFKSFQINARLLQHAKQGAQVMHCLPAHRGQEITDDVLEGKQSIVWPQAENKLHVARGLLAALIP